MTFFKSPAKVNAESSISFLFTPWPSFEYEKVPISVGARRWWEPGYWTNKWYLDPVSRTEIQKGYGLTQNPGW